MARNQSRLPSPKFRITLTLELTTKQMDELRFEWFSGLPEEATLKEEIRHYLGLKVVTAKIALAPENGEACAQIAERQEAAVRRNEKEAA